MFKSNIRRSNRAVQCRNVMVMTYSPLSHIEYVLKTHSQFIRAYAYIYHDKFSPDELGNKDHKEPHFHVVLRLFRPFTESAISKWFVYYNEDGLKQRVDVQSTSDVFSSYDYLIHKHNPEKYQYDFTDVTVSDPYLFKRSSDKVDDDNAINALDDLLAGVPSYTIFKRYGRDVLYHYSALRYAAYIIRHELKQGCNNISDVDDLSCFDKNNFNGGWF